LIAVAEPAQPYNILSLQIGLTHQARNTSFLPKKVLERIPQKEPLDS
jgi:hypothetical protein